MHPHLRLDYSELQGNKECANTSKVDAVVDVLRCVGDYEIYPDFLQPLLNHLMLSCLIRVSIRT